MKRSQTFGTDNHTYAGREHLIDMMMRHQQRLKDIAEGKREVPKGRQLYNGMNTTQTLDNHTPRTFNLAKQIESKGDKRRSIWHQQLQHHQETLNKSLQRMQTYPTPTERRANRFDPVAHPVQFKRSHAVPMGPTGVRDMLRNRVERDIMYSTGATRSQRYYYAHPLTGRLMPRAAYDSALLMTQQMDGQGRRSRQDRPSSRIEEQRPRTAGETRRTSVQRKLHEYEEKEEMRGSRSRGNSVNSNFIRPQTAQPTTCRSASRIIPASTGHKSLSSSYDAFDSDYDSDDSTSTASSTAATNPYDQLYTTLVSLLLAHRISTADGVERLLARAADVNAHLDRAKVAWVCDAVREEMRVMVEGEEDDRREERRMRAWRMGEEEEESRAESEEEEEPENEDGDAEDERESKEEETLAAEKELKSLAAQPFYQRPSQSEDEEVATRSRPNEKSNREQPPDVRRQLQPSAQPAAEKTSPPASVTSDAKPPKMERPIEPSVIAKEESKAAAAADDEWYENDIEPADEAAGSGGNSARYDAEVVRVASGTHTIEEGDEGEEEERAVVQTSEKESIEQEAAPAVSEDEYGEEKYEDDEEQYEEEF